MFPQGRESSQGTMLIIFSSHRLSNSGISAIPVECFWLFPNAAPRKNPFLALLFGSVCHVRLGAICRCVLKDLLVPCRAWQPLLSLLSLQPPNLCSAPAAFPVRLCCALISGGFEHKAAHSFSFSWSFESQAGISPFCSFLTFRCFQMHPHAQSTQVYYLQM